MRDFTGLVAVLVICFWTPSVFSAAGSCSSWPKGMVFVGLLDGRWETYIVPDHGEGPIKVALKAEARTPAYSSKKNMIIYIDEAGDVKRYSLDLNKSETILTPPDDTGYAQPEYDLSSDSVFLVALKGGKSVDTDIVRLGLKGGSLKSEVIQRSAQFEPELKSGWLYYSNVHCVVGCGKIIQEIWRYNTASGSAEQITLLNSISRQPSVNEDGSWLYFSSNSSGNYHLYRQSLSEGDGKVLERITRGAVTDISPVVHEEHLYFIRHDALGAHLMCGSDAGNNFVSFGLPEGVTDIRDLEIE